MKIQRGDTVVVTTGDSAGAHPRRVVQVVDGGKRLVIEGVNSVLKHVRRGHPKSPQGGQLRLEMPIDASNVKLYCQSCNTPTRVGYRYTNDGSKERYCKKCGGTVGTVSPPKARYAKK